MAHRKSLLTPAVYVATALTGAVLCWWATSSFMLAIVPSVVLFLFIEVLSRNLPMAMRESMTQNCRRSDGSWSVRREKAEASAVTQFRRHMLVSVTIVLLLSYALVWFVHTEVIPLSIGIDALSKFESPSQAWRENLEPEEQELDSWAREQGISSEEMQDRKQLLWAAWPAVIAIGIGWMIIVATIIRTAYFRGLKELSESIVLRQRNYQLHDSRMDDVASRRLPYASDRASQHC